MLLGNYLVGIYYFDKIKVGWWKIGYLEYFVKVFNVFSWVGINIDFDGEVFDFVECKVEDFCCELNMKEGYLLCIFKVKMKSGWWVKVEVKCFCSIVCDEIVVLEYCIMFLDFFSFINIMFYVDFDVENEDFNYDEKFWVEVDKKVKCWQGYVIVEMKKIVFQVCMGMKFSIEQGGKEVDFDVYCIEKEKYVACLVDLACKEGEIMVIYKYVVNVIFFNYKKKELMDCCKVVVKEVYKEGFQFLLCEQVIVWGNKWEEVDICIEGDVVVQQGIRFNIFQLY